MAPTNRSKARKAEVAILQWFSKNVDTELNFSKNIDTDLKHLKKPIIVSPPRTSTNSNNDATESKCTLLSFGLKAALCKQYSNTRHTKL